MARATSDPTPIPRLRDLVRDPVVRESFRREKRLQEVVAFVDGKLARKRPTMTRIVFTNGTKKTIRGRATLLTRPSWPSHNPVTNAPGGAGKSARSRRRCWAAVPSRSR
jgi:hypothetical protein